MKYDCIEIRYDFYKKDFKVSAWKDEYDRVKSEYFVNPLGFFHHPRKMKFSTAFKMLKIKLIKDLEEEIEKRNEFLDKLKQVELPIRFLNEK